MTLATMKEGERARIVRVTGEEAVKRHLLAVHESRIAVDDATAQKVEVESV